MVVVFYAYNWKSFLRVPSLFIGCNLLVDKIGFLLNFSLCLVSCFGKVEVSFRSTVLSWFFYYLFISFFNIYLFIHSVRIKTLKHKELKCTSTTYTDNLVHVNSSLITSKQFLMKSNQSHFERSTKLILVHKLMSCIEKNANNYNLET